MIMHGYSGLGQELPSTPLSIFKVPGPRFGRVDRSYYPLPPAPPQPAVVNPSPPALATNAIASTASGMSAVSQANGGTLFTGRTVGLGQIDPWGIAPSDWGAGEWAFIIFGGLGLIWFLRGTSRGVQKVGRGVKRVRRAVEAF